MERVANSDVHVVLDHVQFERHSHTNRNQILVGSKRQWLTIPVQTAGRGLDIPINELLIDNRAPWRRKHLGSISHAYGKLPGHRLVADLLEREFAVEGSLLVDVVGRTTAALLEVFGIATPRVLSSTMDLNQSKSDLVLEICQLMEADAYLSGPMGRDYLDLPSFSRAGISVEFHDFQATDYEQSGGAKFEPNLSCVDALARLGLAARDLVGLTVL